MLIESQMAKKAVWRERPRKRAEQQRSIETRASILNAAIAEFAERGFEGASIRAIADRLGATSADHLSLSQQGHSLAGGSGACLRADSHRVGYFGAGRL